MERVEDEEEEATQTVGPTTSTAGASETQATKAEKAVSGISTRTASERTGRHTAAATSTTESLVDDTDQVLDKLSLSRARRITVAIAIAMAAPLGTLPANPHPFMRALGGLSIVSIVLLVLAMRRSAAGDGSHRLKGEHLAVMGFWATAPLPFFFGPFGNMAPAGGALLLIFAIRAPKHLTILATLGMALPHATAVIASTMQWIAPTGMLVMEHDVLGKIVSGTQSIVVYVLGTSVGWLVGARSQRSLEVIQAQFRKVSEREALLREARQELERAAGVGQQGRFTGAVFGSYKLGTLLGRGGMGEVYDAKHIDSSAPAAVKLVRFSSSQSAGAMNRFEREAQVARSIDSPHVVRVLEVGRADEHVLPFIAMERLDGSGLADILRTQLRLSTEEMLDMLEQVATGLHAAHKAGIVHRDIKPDNLHRTSDGIWKILDFGVAQVLEDTIASSNAMAGTPGYMAPEQLNEESVLDHRVDVHALGAVLYRALTGQPAFSGRSSRATLRALQRTLPERPSNTRSVPTQVDAVLRIALAKDPADRFESVAELSDAMQAAVDGTLGGELAERASQLEQQLNWDGGTMRGASW